MAVLDVAPVEAEGSTLLIVFVPPETQVFHDGQRARLRDLLINALVSHGLTGELVAVWEYDGHLQFMGNPRWGPYLSQHSFTNLHAHANHQISVD